jgi:hypothetical protein
MYIIITPVTLRWPGNTVGIATGYGLDGPEIELVYVELSTKVVLVALTPVWFGKSKL